MAQHLFSRAQRAGLRFDSRAPVGYLHLHLHLLLLPPDDQGSRGLTRTGTWGGKCVVSRSFVYLPPFCFVFFSFENSHPCLLRSRGTGPRRGQRVHRQPRSFQLGVGGCFSLHEKLLTVNSRLRDTCLPRTPQLTLPPPSAVRNAEPLLSLAAERCRPPGWFLRGVRISAVSPALASSASVAGPSPLPPAHPHTHTQTHTHTHTHSRARARTQAGARSGTPGRAHAPCAHPR